MNVKKYKGNVFTFKVEMFGDRFLKSNGVKEFFDKDYGVFGKAFILVKKNCLGSFQLLNVVPLREEQRDEGKGS